MNLQISHLKNFLIKNKYKSELILFLIISLIFMFLYGKYIFGGDAYIFVSNTDIGNDQYYTYYPRLYYLIDSIRNGEFLIYDFELGFGMTTYTLYNILLNPLDGILIFFGTDYLAHGLLFVTYLKLIWIGLFAYWYFKQLWNNNYSSIITSLLWTFCSFNMIWGQHYFILTSMAFFTSFMYLLHKFLQKEERICCSFILIMLLFVIQSYYFFYMAGIFSVLYILFYGWFTNKRITWIFKKILYLVVMAILAIMLSSFMLMPIMYTFFNSARVGGIIEQNSSILITVKEFITMLSRMFNPDILGGAYGIPFSGSLNYYEAPLLFVSILMIPSILYALNERNNRKKKIILLLLFLFSLICKICNLIFTFTVDAYRWCFILDFIIVITIGYFIDSKKKMSEKNLIIESFVLLIILVGILLLSDYFDIVDIHLKYLLLYTCIFTILLYFHIKYKGRQLILALIVIEIVISYYPTFYNRGTESYEMINVKGYEDGTKEVVEKLKEIDNSFYRINKTYDSVFYNDSYIQEFKGVRVYTSVNSKYLYSYFKANNLPILSNHPNYLAVPFDNIKINGDLSVKYYISNSKLNNTKEIFSYNGYYVYENEEYLPFGYLLDNNQIPSSNNSAIFLENITYKDNQFKGIINNLDKKEEKLLLTIPYSKKEYTVYMDGEECETFILNDGFLGIDIPPGEHKITIVFKIPYLIEGCIISVIGIVFYMLLIGNRYFISNRKLNTK